MLDLFRPAPLTTGCSGTVILAHLPAAEAGTLLAARPRGEHRPDADALDRIRTDGYAISRNANHAGVAGVAAALLEPDDGYPLGSLAIAGPDHRLPDRTLQQLAGPLTAAARELAPQLAAVLGATHQYARTPWTSPSRTSSAPDARGQARGARARFTPPGSHCAATSCRKISCRPDRAR